MAFQRVVARKLPDGRTAKVFPFHISLEGMETVTLCRDDEDYDQLEKGFYVSSWKTNTLPIIGIAMSNHGHLGLLAEDMEKAVETGQLIKKRHSQYLSWKYGEKGLMGRSAIDVRLLDSEWYVRNALAYIPRNALDTGERIEDYRWSGYRGMFTAGRCPAGVKQVSQMSTRDWEDFFHTHEDLSRVPWVLNVSGQVEPASACDYEYLESAFGNDQAYFLKTIGTVNMAEMQEKLVLSSRVRQTDTEMLAIISNLADKWFHKTALELTPEMKARLAPYLYRSYRTSVPQMARCLRLSKDHISRLIPRKKP